MAREGPRATLLALVGLVFVLVSGTSAGNAAGAQEKQERPDPEDKRRGVGARGHGDGALPGRQEPRQAAAHSLDYQDHGRLIASRGVDLDEEVTISDQAERFVGSGLQQRRLISGERLSVRSSSRRLSPQAQTPSTPWPSTGGGGGKAGVENFVDEMNHKAKQMGLENTHFEDPAGLTPQAHSARATWPRSRVLRWLPGVQGHSRHRGGHDQHPG